MLLTIKVHVSAEGSHRRAVYKNISYFPAHKTHFSHEKCELNSTCVLCAEGKHYFQTYK